ncbi:hypothetical protein ACEQ8H_005521 [Pleosporales sp. CAS-2024a]
MLGSDTLHNNLHFDGRAAPNVGIYNRVCHREAQAKRGFKFATLLINGCLGLQIIVAAALTAMGAANSNHVGITTFGAINTVIAGLLTYLKGSGLPNRIRYYENEWKRIREYIEQRERDFSRPGCRLDVNEVVSAIEAMYEQVKIKIQTNTPDSYISGTDLRARASASVPQMAHFHAPSAGAAAAAAGRSKLEELELKYGHKAADFLEGLAHKEEARLKRIQGDMDTSKARALAALHDGRTTVQDTRTHWGHQLDSAQTGAQDYAADMHCKGATMAQRELAHAHDWEQDMREKGARIADRELQHAQEGVSQRGQRLVQQLDNIRDEVLKRSEDVVTGLDAVKRQ